MAMTNEEAHALSRKRGTSFVYELARFDEADRAGLERATRVFLDSL